MQAASAVSRDRVLVSLPLPHVLPLWVGRTDEGVVMKGPLTVDRGEWCSACCWPLGTDKASGARVPIRRDGRWVHRCSVCGGRTDEPETNMVCDCCGIILERGLEEPVTARCAGCILAGKSPNIRRES